MNCTNQTPAERRLRPGQEQQSIPVVISVKSRGMRGVGSKLLDGTASSSCSCSIAIGVSQESRHLHASRTSNTSLWLWSLPPRCHVPVGAENMDSAGPHSSCTQARSTGSTLQSLFLGWYWILLVSLECFILSSFVFSLLGCHVLHFWKCNWNWGVFFCCKLLWGYIYTKKKGEFKIFAKMKEKIVRII